MAETTQPPGAIPVVSTLSFEDALQRLETIVGQLETGRVSLEQSIALYSEGSALKSHCAAKLRDAQLRVEQLQIGADGGVAGSTPFATDAA